jgi:RNA polymerase sigma factor (sigma-70 family)
MTAMDRKRDYEHLLQAHRGIVHKVAYSYSRNADDRDDLVQEICLQLWRSFSSYDPTRRFSTWMYRIALNVAISHVRHASLNAPGTFEPLSEIHLETIGTSENNRQDEQLDALHGFISQLEPLNRAVMVLYLDERSYVEIAEIVGLSETNVATKINRIKQKLRGQMAAMTGA